MNLNKAIIIGNLTQDPEVRNTAAGQSVASFTVATNRIWNDQQGQRQQQAEFHNIVAWGKLAEIVGQYLAKGRLCMVEGRLQTRNWDDQNGVRHWKTEIVAENIQLGPRSGQGNYGGNNNFEAANKPAPETLRQSAPTTDQSANGDSDEEIKIEDIPF
ncbi:MAG TPA: single-stranded DNA-binding protein [bacterium]|jgi:single-strand DNA-binding protein|nr:single-stranded DNA-binding protein [bacterium]HNS34300.1 single-stranded DNA-binding protein [bacterium]HNW09526.1 single-stranded DNA-binding protein [bacterium]HNZ73495.1 single-stranded DNA-binding protein [bacterium]HOH67362.1 single-stranded DNA-binding protein [bacterium]